MGWLSQQSAEFWAIIAVGLLLSAAIGETRRGIGQKLAEIADLLRDRRQ